MSVDIKNEEVIQNILKIQTVLEKSGGDLKSIEPKNLHFTLHFFGELSVEESVSISDVLKNIHVSPFKISFKGLGFFPSSHRISVIWVGVDEGRKEFIDLAEQIEPKLEMLNFKSEKKFTPHLTICRVRSGKNKDELYRSAENFFSMSFGTDTISLIKLKESKLTPKGPFYSDLFEQVLS